MLDHILICESPEEIKSYFTEQEKWIPKDLKKGALHKDLGIAQDKPIPTEVLTKKKAELQKKGEGDKKLTAKELQILKRINLALTLRKF